MPPEQILAAILVAGIILYTLLGGADFGVGVWEFSTFFQSSEKEKNHLYRAIGPVWEANHVWLIFILVILFSAFPRAFASVCRTLWLPLLLALVGIIFRGVGFAFRSYAAGMVKQQAIWGAIFSFGAVASGKSSWLSPFSIYSAFFFVGVCAYLSAVYLAREAGQSGATDLVTLWRRRSLTMGVWMGILAVTGLAIIATDAPSLWEGFKLRSWPFVILSVLSGATSLWALLRSRFVTAITCSQIAVVSVILGWATAQYPFLIPSVMTIESAKSPDTVLWSMIWSLALGSVILIPSLFYLFYLFKGKRP
ncbi:MAG: hypothetical protein A2W61_07920 [Deltaproteobacteria bacterium RIFCSPLOWO2_01_44_7]|nr:MAG: hypothetical protein A2W61_07920 [Deltaproteobacteria bacterium RIFCSPLOWO2_01_44_7]